MKYSGYEFTDLETELRKWSDHSLAVTVSVITHVHVQSTGKPML